MNTNNNVVGIGCNKNASVSVKQILSACWGDYIADHEVADYQKKEVEKALDCYGHNKGCFVSQV